MSLRSLVPAADVKPRNKRDLQSLAKEAGGDGSIPGAWDTIQRSHAGGEADANSAENKTPP